MKTTPAKRAVFKPPVLHGFHAAANRRTRIKQPTLMGFARITPCGANSVLPASGAPMPTPPYAKACATSGLCVPRRHPRDLRTVCQAIVSGCRCLDHYPLSFTDCFNELALFLVAHRVYPGGGKRFEGSLNLPRPLKVNIQYPTENIQ